MLFVYFMLFVLGILLRRRKTGKVGADWEGGVERQMRSTLNGRNALKLIRREEAVGRSR